MSSSSLHYERVGVGPKPIARETQELLAARAAAAPAWLATLRNALAGAGPHLAWEGSNGLEIRPLAEGFSRLGRSVGAEIHLADTTVSRRHALLHHEGGSCTLLDDHSLNGVFVDGRRVDWQPLADGQEISLGALRLQFVDA